jgi:WD40 repeat protein
VFENSGVSGAAKSRASASFAALPSETQEDQDANAIVGVVAAPDALACVVVPMRDAVQLRAEIEQQLILEYEAVEDVRELITAERERLRVSQLELARNRARNDGTLAEFDAMRELELQREAAARAKEAELSLEPPQSPRSLRRERQRRRKRELEAEHKRIVASREREPAYKFRTVTHSLALNVKGAPSHSTAVAAGAKVAPDALSVLVAFERADVLHLDAKSRSFTRDWAFQKCLEGAEINIVRWLPDSTEQFVAATSNGMLMWCDVNRALVSPITVGKCVAPSNGARNGSSSGSSRHAHKANGAAAPAPEEEDDVSQAPFLRVASQSVADANPLSLWRIGALSDSERRHDERVLDKSATNSEILSLEFGCGEAAGMFALTCVDGSLRFFATSPRPQFLCAVRSDFGAFTCIAFAPSGRYLVAGGESDTIRVYSLRPPSARHAKMRLPKLVAVCVGHRSFVRSLTFDPHQAARLVSGGDDCRLLLWDLQLDSHRQRRPDSAGAANSGAGAAPADDGDDTQSSSSGSRHHASRSPLIAERESSPPSVPTVVPVASHAAHVLPIVSVACTESSLITCDAAGQVRVWARPESKLAQRPD